MLPGPQNLVDAREALRAVGERRDGLGAAGREDAVGAGHGGCCQLDRRHDAVRPRRADQDEVLDAGDLGRDQRVQDGGRVHRQSAGGVDADVADGAHLHAQALVDVGGEHAAHLPLVVAAHAAGRELQRVAQLRLDGVDGGLDLGARDLEARVREAIEDLAVAAHGRVTLATHIGDDALHALASGKLLAKDGRGHRAARFAQLKLGCCAAAQDGASCFVGADEDTQRHSAPPSRTAQALVGAGPGRSAVIGLTR